MYFYIKFNVDIFHTISSSGFIIIMFLYFQETNNTFSF